MTLNLALRSFKVIDFGTNRERVYMIFLLVADGNLDPVLHRFRDENEIRRLAENRHFSLPYSSSG